MAMVAVQIRHKSNKGINKLDAEWLLLLEEHMRLAVIEVEKVRVEIECNSNKERACCQGRVSKKIKRRYKLSNRPPQSERWVWEEAERKR